MDILNKINTYLKEESDKPEENENYGNGFWVISPLNNGKIWKVKDYVDYSYLYSGPFKTPEEALKEKETLRKKYHKSTVVMFIKNNRISE